MAAAAAAAGRLPVAVVVGSGGGIGAALVQRLLAAGTHRVVATTRHPASTVTPSLPSSVPVLAMDPTEEGSIAAAVERLSTEVPGVAEGGVSLVVSCAGVLHHDGQQGGGKDGGWQGGRAMPEKTIRAVEADWMLHSYLVNCVAPALVAKHFAPLLTTASGGRRGARAGRAPAVLASLSARVGSIADNGLGGWYSYRASKAGLNQVTKTLSHELRPQNVVCCTLHPGTVETHLSAPWQRNVQAGKLFTPEDSAARMLRVLAGLGLEDTGRLLAYDGQVIPF